MHGGKICLFVYLTPIHALLEILFENKVEPDTGTATIAFHERVGYIHLYVFIYNLVEGCFWHLLNLFEALRQILGATEKRTIFPNGLCADLSRKVIEPSEDVGVNLLRCLDCTDFIVLYDVALPKCIGFLATLTIDGVF